MQLEVSPPSKEPLTLDEVRIHLRQLADPMAGDSPAIYDPAPDDSWVTAKITAARQMAEAFLGFPLTDAVYMVGFDDFGVSQPCLMPWQQRQLAPGLRLPDGADEVTAVQYLDTKNALHTLGGTTFSFDPFNGMLFVDAPPQLSSRASPVRVSFRGAYGGADSPSLPVPELIKQAMLVLIGDWYENREDSVMDVRATTASAQNGFQAILRPLRTRLGMA